MKFSKEQLNATAQSCKCSPCMQATICKLILSQVWWGDMRICNFMLISATCLRLLMLQPRSFSRQGHHYINAVDFLEEGIHRRAHMVCVCSLQWRLHTNKAWFHFGQELQFSLAHVLAFHPFLIRNNFCTLCSYSGGLSTLCVTRSWEQRRS